MDPRTKILILEKDCGRLTSLMLWLEQFQEFQVRGTLRQLECPVQERIFDDCEILLVGANAVSGEDIKRVRTAKLSPLRPAIVLLSQGNTNSCEGQIANESEAIIKVDASLHDLYDELKKVAQRRKVSVSPSWLPASKAS
jgi:hypothetical protein